MTQTPQGRLSVRAVQISELLNAVVLILLDKLRLQPGRCESGWGVGQGSIKRVLSKMFAIELLAVGNQWVSDGGPDFSCPKEGRGGLKRQPKLVMDTCQGRRGLKRTIQPSPQISIYEQLLAQQGHQI